MKTTTATRKKATTAKKTAPATKSSSSNVKTATRTSATLPKTSKSKTSNTLEGESDSTTVARRSNMPFKKLFIDLLKDIYWAEQHLVESLPEMSNAATTDVLKSAFDDHHYQTQKHVKRLEQVFELMGYEAEAKKCDVMEGLVKEAQHTIRETPENSMTRDAGLIIAAQKIEHYEIATYGSLVQVALTLEEDKVAYILERTLSEEEDADHELTNIAEMDINPMADHEDEDGQDFEPEEE